VYRIGTDHQGWMKIRWIQTTSRSRSMPVADRGCHRLLQVDRILAGHGAGIPLRPGDRLDAPERRC
jgi:hypothetical protein